MPPKRKLDVYDPMGPCPMEIDRPEPPKKKRKTPIPRTLKRKVWRKWLTEDIGSVLCPVCESTKIFQDDHHCAHIIAEAEGGSTTEDNLIPVCAGCNLSMGKKPYYEFKQTWFPSKR